LGGFVKKKTYEEVKAIFEAEGCTLLSTEYKSNKQKLDYVCKRGHLNSITADHFMRKVGCSVCSGYKKKSIEEVRGIFIGRGYTLLSLEYSNNKQILEYLCNRGHYNRANLTDFCRSTIGCCECSHRKKKTIEEVKAYVKSIDYTLLSTEYKNCDEKLELVCNKGHFCSISWDNLSHGKRCRKCTSLTSRSEKNVFSFVSSIYGGCILENTRSVIPPYEVDIYLPDLNLAIEYCGLYWHSEKAGKDKQYHQKKFLMCREKGIRLVTIFEDELLNKRDELLDYLKSLINPSKDLIFSKNTLKIDARFPTSVPLEELGYSLVRITKPKIYHESKTWGRVWDCGGLIYQRQTNVLSL
jgi:very-short-patch-repair endonuclease